MAGTLFKKVLVPVDFSACSDEAFRVFLQLADAVDADVTVMHVIDVNAVDAFNRLGLLAVPSDATRQRKRLRHHARLRMRQLLKSPLAVGRSDESSWKAPHLLRSQNLPAGREST